MGTMNKILAILGVTTVIFIVVCMDLTRLKNYGRDLIRGKILMSKSELVDIVKLSPNCTKPRSKKISKITIHHMAGKAVNMTKNADDS